jgi:phosphoenolpyruvate carboxylase
VDATPVFGYPAYFRDRFPEFDPHNHVPLELLKRYRAGDTDERVVKGIDLTIDGIAAGLRNSGWT